MKSNTNIEDKPRGVEKLWAWKYRVPLILEEHVLEDYVKGEVADPEGDEDNAKEAKKIIADSTKDHLTPHVSSLKTSKEMFDINMKMT